MLYVSIVVALICFGFLMASFKFMIPQSVVDILNNISFAMVAALIATRGWLMSEEQVMKSISNWYAALVGIMMLLIFSLAVTKLWGNTSEGLDFSIEKYSNQYNEEIDNATTIELKDSIKELEDVISELQLKVDTLNQTIISQNTTIGLMQEALDRCKVTNNKVIKECNDIKNRMNSSNQEK